MRPDKQSGPKRGESGTGMRQTRCPDPGSTPGPRKATSSVCGIWPGQRFAGNDALNTAHHATHDDFVDHPHGGE